MQLTERGDFEWTAIIININPEYNKGIQKNCKGLYDYISYIARVKINQKNNLNIKDAVDEAVNWAIKENLLDGFFKEHKAEVEAMILTEFDKDLYDKNRRKEGYDEGAQAKAVEAAKKLYNNGVSIEIIAKSLEMTLEQVQEIVKSNKTKV